MESLEEMVLMRMLVTGNKSATQRGFSLVELLVVLVVMGLVTGVAVLALPKSQPPSERVAAALASELAAQRSLAIINAETRGIDSIDGRLAITRFDQGQWVEIPATWRRPPKGLSDVTIDIVPTEDFDLPEDERTAPRLYIDGKRLKASSMTPPPLRFDPTGEVTPGTMMIGGPDQIWSVSIDGAGEVEVSRE